MSTIYKTVLLFIPVAVCLLLNVFVKGIAQTNVMLEILLIYCVLIIVLKSMYHIPLILKGNEHTRYFLRYLLILSFYLSIIMLTRSMFSNDVLVLYWIPFVLALLIQIVQFITEPSDEFGFYSVEKLTKGFQP